MISMTLAPSRLTLILITLLALGPSLVDARGQPKACGSEIRRIDVNQTTLHYFECGKGEPLIFVHGALGDLQTFQAQVQTFATSFRVIVYSRRFFPPNAPPRETDVDPLTNHLADLRALITQLKATPAHLVGSSYGAYVALALAVDHPELVRSLVLGEPPVGSLLSRTSVGEDMRQSWVRRVNEPSRKAFERGDIEGSANVHGRHLWNRVSRQPPARVTGENGVGGKTRASIAIALHDRSLRRLPSSRLWNSAEIVPPVTGERSFASALLVTAELEGCLEGESEVMVPEAGHGMHNDNPAFYNQTVMAFLQRR